jgi:hypothetical protein
MPYNQLTTHAITLTTLVYCCEFCQIGHFRLTEFQSRDSIFSLLLQVQKTGIEFCLQLHEKDMVPDQSYLHM